MKRKMVRIALVLTAVGALCMLIALYACGFRWEKLDPASIDMRTYEITEDFDSVRIKSAGCSVWVKASKDGVSRVILDADARISCDIRVENGVAVIEVSESSDMFSFIRFRFRQDTVYLELPEREYASLQAAAVSAEIRMEDELCFENVSLTGESGDVVCSLVTVSDGIYLSTGSGDVLCGSVNACGGVRLSSTSGSVLVGPMRVDTLEAETDSGRIDISDTVADVSISAKGDSGWISLNRSDAPDVDLRTGSGDIFAQLLSGKVFTASTGSGSIDIPPDTEGGRCFLETGSGYISVTVGK